MIPLKRRVALGAAAVLTAVSLAACGESSGASGGGGDSKDDGDIVIGLVNPTSGPLAAVGASMNGAVQAAVDEVNADGGIDGRQIKLDIKDNKADPTQSVSIVNQWISEGVDLIIGGADSSSASAIGPIASAKKVPYMSLGAGDWSQITDNYVFQVPINTAEEGVAISAQIDKLGLTAPAVIYSSTPYGVGIKDGVEDQGVEPVAAEQIDITAKDFTANVTRLLADKPDAIIMAAAGTAVAIVLKNLEDQGYDGTVIASQALFTLPIPAITEIAGDTALTNTTGNAFPSLVTDTLPSDDPRVPILEAYESGFEEATGGPDVLGGFGVSGYDAVMIFKAAVEAAGSSNGTEVRDALQETTDLVEAAATYTFGPDDNQGQTVTDTVEVKFEGGTWVAVE